MATVDVFRTKLSSAKLGGAEGCTVVWSSRDKIAKEQRLKEEAVV